MKPKNFDRRSFIGLVVFSCSVAFIVALGLFWQHKQSVKRLVDESLMFSAQELAANFSVPLKVKNLPELKRTLSASLLKEKTTFIGVYDDIGQQVIAYPDQEKTYDKSLCKSFFREVAISFSKEPIGKLSYCYRVTDSRVEQFSYLLFILVVGGSLLVSVLLFTYQRSQTQGILSFIEEISKIELENPSPLKMPKQRTNNNILALHEKMNDLLGKLLTARDEIKRRERETAFVSVAQQVAHDIRSPLTAVEMVARSTLEIPEKRRVLLREASQRIRDIANNLLSQNTSTDSQSELKQETTLLSSIVDLIVSEKRVQFRSKMNVEITPVLNIQSYGRFSTVNPVELKRILSNLINNAVEALQKDGGQVEVGVNGYKDRNVIYIKDNGIGIPADILEKIGQKGVSFGKDKMESGSGLGLFYAREVVSQFEGEVKIESQPGNGTKVSILLPNDQPPKWFLPSIELTPNMSIVVLDDDVSIHQIWKGRFESALKHRLVGRLHNLSSPEDLRKWVSENGKKDVVFLCDYELLNFNETGLDLIEELSLQDSAVLVTSRFEEVAIRSRCESLGLRLLPKGLATLVPLMTSDWETDFSLDAILIDNDELVHSIWIHSAEMKSKKVKVFFSVEQFRKEADEIPQETPIYIDSQLDNDVRGEDAAQEIYERGFQNIYLCTGYPERFQGRDLKWLRGILGKDPPWSH